MEVVILIGVQATGKSAFYRRTFQDTHVRVNLDMLRTRRRESLIFGACLQGKTRCVIDNTNILRGDRARYIAPARENKFRVIGYYFASPVAVAFVGNWNYPGAMHSTASCGTSWPPVSRRPDIAPLRGGKYFRRGRGRKIMSPW